MSEGRIGLVFLVGLALGGGGAAAVVYLPDDATVLPSSSYVAEASLGDSELRAPEVGQALLDLAVSTIASDGSLPAESLTGLAPRPVVVCSHVHPPLCARSSEPTVKDAVVAAAERIREQGARPVRVSVDVEVLERSVSWEKPGYRKRDPGVWGYRAGDAALTPSQVLSRTVYGGKDEDKEFRVEVLRSELQSRLPRGSVDVGELPLHRFRTVAWVDDGSGQAQHTFRLHRQARPSVAPDVLEQRAAWAADHLASTIESSGRVRYLYDVAHGMERSGYNLLRHGGTTYSLLQAYERFEHEPWLRASEAAIGFLLKNSRRDIRNGPFGGGETLWVEESSYVKLGGSGLALVMLTQHMQATGEDTHLEDARAYARYLVSQQQESGEFVYFANKTPGGPARDRTSAYYPGEAILGLAQLYAIDPDPLWLDTATRGADWLIDVRDAGKGPKELANDHWLMIALSHLVRHTDDERYVAHSKALAAAVEYQAARNRSKIGTHPDYFGGYYDPPRSTPAATRGEGLVAVLDTCALRGEDCSEVQQLLSDTVTHELWSQYGPADTWWMPNPGAVVGGFSGGIMDPDLRNDFTQHNLSSVLGTERHLRDVDLPGGPTWSWTRQGPFEPPPPRSMDELLQPLRALRGLHRWDPRDPPTETP